MMDSRIFYSSPHVDFAVCCANTSSLKLTSNDSFSGGCHKNSRQVSNCSCSTHACFSLFLFIFSTWMTTTRERFALGPRRRSPNIDRNHILPPAPCTADAPGADMDLSSVPTIMENWTIVTQHIIQPVTIPSVTRAHPPRHAERQNKKPDDGVDFAAKQVVWNQVCKMWKWIL